MLYPELAFNVESWACWSSDSPAVEGEEGAWPACRFVDAAARRRLTPLAKVALEPAHACLQGRADVRVVFASRHGEVNRTRQMLASLVAGEQLSPTAFSLSVHNAIPGLYSIFRNDSAPVTAIAAGERTLAAGLVQAVMELGQSGGPVLLLYADVPLADDYPGLALSDARRGVAIALLLRQGDSRRMRREPVCEVRPSVATAYADMTAWLRGENKTAFVADGAAGWRLDHVVPA